MPMTPLDRLHAVPLPVTWDLLGELRRRVQPPLADTLSSIFDEAVSRTMLHARPLEGASPDRAVESLIRVYAPLRREWLDVAREAVGDEGITPLRVEALALARGAVSRIRPSSAVRDELEGALGDVGPLLSGFGAALRDRRDLDAAPLRRLATRFDWCMTAALLAETDGCFGGLRLVTPLLCAEARAAAAEIRRRIGPRPPSRRAARPRVPGEEVPARA